jgi:Nucleotidyl transferase AbiEii toxin, Type IV TA system
MDFGRFLDVLRAFERAEVEYILVGGVAVNLHGIVRATEDIDFFLRPDAANIERVKVALRSIWQDPEIDLIRVEDFGKYPTLRYAPPSEEIVVDLLTRLGTTFAYDDLEAEKITIEGVSVRIATPRTLVRMKRNTLRMIDKADAAALVRAFRIEEEA